MLMQQAVRHARRKALCHENFPRLSQLRSIRNCKAQAASVEVTAMGRDTRCGGLRRYHQSGRPHERHSSILSKPSLWPATAGSEEPAWSLPLASLLLSPELAPAPAAGVRMCRWARSCRRTVRETCTRWKAPLAPWNSATAIWASFSLLSSSLLSRPPGRATSPARPSASSSAWASSLLSSSWQSISTSSFGTGAMPKTLSSTPPRHRPAVRVAPATEAKRPSRPWTCSVPQHSVRRFSLCSCERSPSSSPRPWPP
mmetsp:Transcript_107658/g.347474  ORF Transcript_107658/g.347474 Transcript_107658/m.347474 type:complete len:256 (+) Transcript_107658:106-873(+)